MGAYTRQQLVVLSEALLRHTGWSESRLGILAAKNDRLFSRLRAGLDCYTATAELASDYFDRNWPDDLRWPKQVTRRARRLARPELSRQSR